MKSTTSARFFVANARAVLWALVLGLLLQSCDAQISSFVDQKRNSRPKKSDQSFTLQFDPTALTITEGQASTVSIKILPPQASSVAVDLVLNGVSGAGRFAPIPTRVSIPAGQDRVTFVLTSIDDALVQSSQSWTLSLSSADQTTASALLNGSNLPIQLNDNDGGTTGGAVSQGVPVLLGDFNRLPKAIERFDMGNGKILFQGSDATHGKELWIGDGTVAGTYLLKDTNPGNVSGSPRSFSKNPNTSIVYFTAYTGVDGTSSKMWRTDGTPAGTYIITSIPVATGGAPSVITHIGNKAIVFTTTGLMASKIYATDGTIAGTTDLFPTTTFYNVGGVVNFNGEFHFGATTVSGGFGGTAEIFKTDGTPGGSSSVVTIDSFSNFSPPHCLLVWNNKMYFQGYDTGGGQGWELWKSDGTQAGTSMVTDLVPGFSSSSACPLMDAGSKFIFSTSNLGLYVSDGTAGGTTSLGGAGTNLIIQFGTIGSNLIYMNSNDSELWKTDGTVGGTSRIKDICPGAGAGLTYSSMGAILGSKILFSANDCTNGMEPWITDGTPAGTIMLKNIMASSGSSNPSDFTVIGTKAIFSATTANGRELWITDGTPAGTVELKDLIPGVQSSGPNNFLVYDTDKFFLTAYNAAADFSVAHYFNLTSGVVTPVPQALVETLNGPNGTIETLGSSTYFAATKDGTGSVLWKTDGTAAGTTAVKDIFPIAGCTQISSMKASGTSLFFVGADETTGTELYVSDGTTSGTQLVSDINPGTASSDVSSMMPLSGNRIFFAATTAAQGRDVWVSNGTSAGTSHVYDVSGTATGGLGAMSITENSTQGKFYIWSFINASGHAGLFVSDGTTGGTTQLSTFGGVTLFSSDAQIIPAGAKTYLKIKNKLWVSDGTPGGTIDITPASTTITFLGAGFSNGNLYFFANSAATGEELYISDGTLAGTVLLKDINPGATSCSCTIPVAFGSNKMIFNTGSQGLYITDGTLAGTVQLSASLRTLYLSSITEWNGNLYFMSAWNADNNFELYKTDGTAAGTVLLKEINPSGGTTIGNFMALGSKLYFTANEPTHGNELWETDGTTAGTKINSDINPGPDSSSPASLKVSNGKLYMKANKILLGTELFVLTP